MLETCWQEGKTRLKVNTIVEKERESSYILEWGRFRGLDLATVDRAILGRDSLVKSVFGQS